MKANYTHKNGTVYSLITAILFVCASVRAGNSGTVELPPPVITNGTWTITCNITNIAGGWLQTSDHPGGFTNAFALTNGVNVVSGPVQGTQLFRVVTYVPWLTGVDPNLLTTTYDGSAPDHWNLEYSPDGVNGWFVGDTTTATPAIWNYEVFGYFYRSVGLDANNQNVTEYSNVWGGYNTPQ